jgi:hypothetical protein
MHHRVGTMLFEHGSHALGVVDIDARQLNAVRYGFGMTSGQIVDDCDRMAPFDQGTDRVAADVTGSAGNYYSRHAISRSSNR